MNKTSLLAGSLSLLGLVTSAIPASAATNEVELPVANVTEAIALQENSAPELQLAEIEAPLVLADQSLSEIFDDINQESLAQDALIDISQEEGSIGVVQSVDQLSDVSPTDWAYQALSELITNWNCIAGYPDGTFRGQRKATRFELAAALNECLNTVNLRFATKEELEAVKRLQEEFAAELAVLKGRVDQLEARTDLLEDQQFSTTTKLQGQVVMAGQFGDFVDNPINTIPVPGFTDPAVAAPTLGAPPPAITDFGSSNPTAIARVRLSLNTSFTGDDLLELTLETGNGGSDFAGLVLGSGNPLPLPDAFNANTFDSGGPFTDLGPVDYAGSGPETTLYRLAYTFKPGENVTLTFGPVIFPSDFIDANSYANDEAADFSSSFFINNPLIIAEPIDGPGGAGGAIDWNVNGGPISVRAFYIAGNGINATGPSGLCAGGFAIAGGTCGGGLGGDPGEAAVEFEYADTFGSREQHNFAVRVQYARVDAFNIHQNVIGFNTELTLNNRFGIFGRYGISIDPQIDTVAAGGGTTQIDLFTFVPGVGANTNIQTWQGGLGYRDLFVPGSLLAASVGQPFVVSGTPADQTNVEFFYRFPINNNISITPTLMYIIDPFNVDTPGNDIFQGLVRATFEF